MHCHDISGEIAWLDVRTIVLRCQSSACHPGLDRYEANGA